MPPTPQRDHGLATCIHGTIGSQYIANEAQAETWFGVIEMEGITPPQYRRHHFTDELVGRAVTWNYSPGLTSMHLYTTPHSLSWIIFGESGAGGMEWSGPANIVSVPRVIEGRPWYVSTTSIFASAGASHRT